MSIPYSPDLADAAQDAFAGQAFDDPGSSAYAAADPARVDAKYFLKPVQDEILSLQAGRVASNSYRQTWTCASGLNVGDPVYVSANDTVTLADATTSTKAQVIGFVRYKPTTTTCYIEHFRYVSGLSGGTAGGKVYLTDAGGFSASAGTVEKIVGQWITTTEALLNATQITALASGVSGGTTSFVPKFASASTLALSAYGDDGTYGTFMALGSSTFNDANARLKWRGTTVPAAYTNAADTSGVDVFFRAQSGGAHSAANPSGANICFMPGTAGSGGSGSDGVTKFFQPGGSEYAKIEVDGTKTYLRITGSELRLGVGLTSDVFGMTSSVWKHFSGSGAISIGQTTRAFGVGYFRGFTADSGQPVNILEPGSSSVSDTNTILRVNTSAPPAAYTNAADFSGKDAIFRCQNGGAHSSNNPSGGGYHIVLGAKGSGGSGAMGQFRVYESSAGAYAYITYSSGSHLYLGTSSGKSLIISPNSSIVFRDAALATGATDGDIYIPSCAGKPTATPTAYTGTVPIRADTTNNCVWGYLNSQWAQIGGAANILPADAQRTFGLNFFTNTPLLLTSDTAYWVYLGYTLKPITIKYVEFSVSTIGAGAQTGEIAIASSTSAPNKGNQTLTKLTADATLDSVLSTGIKRNTSSLDYACAAGVHLWAGIRFAMATTQPTLQGLGQSFNEGMFLSTGTAGALTGAGPWTGALTTSSNSEVPQLRVVLD